MPLISRKEKIWYILQAGKEEGPYSAKQLMLDYRVDLDTLVWKEGFEEWKPIRNVPELNKFFREETEEEAEAPLSKIEPQDELALDMSRDPSPFLFWLIAAVLLVTCMIYLLMNLS